MASIYIQMTAIEKLKQLFYRCKSSITFSNGQMEYASIVWDPGHTQTCKYSKKSSKMGIRRYSSVPSIIQHFSWPEFLDYKHFTKHSTTKFLYLSCNYLPMTIETRQYHQHHFILQQHLQHHFKKLFSRTIQEWNPLCQLN